ncbi:ABC transporter ATP-binding protein [Nocardioides sp. S-58]|uniref:ABC transporter ATP-binding protein n=1 Tax=Nocardioides renjunii TaxID=3095075 RepID=A0ABU5KEJ3_9ACTN|nr:MULTISPECIES: ABC transporter ATP-binding protein [unclassified Nocardioides]MDZ5663376.1 ABC transporter ATP-binding protein [Nocardioides sp. S-58]WQQ22753.1 ABC transporter ATP-binding protein [Nocardioides sp. S-34]
MADIRFANVTCCYAGAHEPAVSGLDLTVTDGELLALYGPPASGKSTVLRILTGLVPVTSGRVLVGGRELADPSVGPMVLVFQNYALQPSLTVLENIGLPLALQRVGKKDVAQRASDAADRVDLTGVLRRRGGTLTTGQRIRVALARALVQNPAALLLDEPLANLQPSLRSEVAELVTSAQQSLGITTVYVTEDPQEAVAIGDRVALLEAGVLREVAAPADLDAPGRGQRVRRGTQDA